MLMDLSKDIMMDLGITVVGDIIAILKHAKLVHRQVRSDFHSVVHFIGDIMHKILLWHIIAQYIRVRFPLLAGHMRSSLPNLSSFFRTCVKWLRKPSPQDRPVSKLSLEELPTLVSVYILLPSHWTRQNNCCFLQWDIHVTCISQAKGNLKLELCDTSCLNQYKDNIFVVNTLYARVRNTVNVTWTNYISSLFGCAALYIFSDI